MKTKKLYDLDAYETSFEATVLSCEVLEKKDENDNHIYAVVLDQTLFFPEEGGQTPDKGELENTEVLDVQIKGDVITHYLAKELEVGKKVRGQIEWQHRFFNMQQHSAEHIFSGLADKKYGYKNVGFHLSNQIVTMDFDGTFTEAQLEEMEWEVNEAIAKNVLVKTGYPSKEELENLPYRSKIEIDADIRIVEVEGYDICACCAPHVHRTGEIGSFKIQSAQNYKGGTRISFLCGFRALEEYRRKAKIITELSGILTTNQDNLPEHVSKLKAQIQTLKAELSNAKKEVMDYKIADIAKDEENVILFERDLDNVVMRSVVNKLVESHEGICAVFVGSDKNGYIFILGSKNIDCRETIKVLKENFDARGGGSAQMVQGSLTATQENIIQKMLSVS